MTQAKEEFTAAPLPQKAVVPDRPSFWFRLSVPAGNALQLAGQVLGWTLLFIDARTALSPAARVVLMLAGWLLIYITCHSLGHYLIGRLVGIRFRGYGVRGTDHPQDYPPVLRQMMSALPTFTVMTEKSSMAAARPLAKALMFGAGESFTAIFSILAGLYAWRAGIPGGFALFAAMIVFNLFSTVMTSIVPRGDYAKARRALSGG
ncbi:MAG TPA: hypothetical protein VF813_03615 [Anaerolineaceae bacterium]